jgi:hypothetical protein
VNEVSNAGATFTVLILQTNRATHCSPLRARSLSLCSAALAVRTSFACFSARSRCSRDLPGTPALALRSDTLRFSSQSRPPVKCASPGAPPRALSSTSLNRERCRAQFPAEKSALVRRDRIYAPQGQVTLTSNIISS